MEGKATLDYLKGHDIGCSTVKVVTHSHIDNDFSHPFSKFSLEKTSSVDFGRHRCFLNQRGIPKELRKFEGMKFEATKTNHLWIDHMDHTGP